VRMRERARRSSVLFLALGALALASCRSAGPVAPPPPPSAPPATRDARPNVVFIVADDLDWSGIEHMPALKALFTHSGTTFTNSYVTTSVCCPSRSSFLTGQYVHNHGVLDNRFPLGGFRKFFESGKEKSTIATWLQEAGYRTGLIGKYLNFYPQRVKNPTYVPPGWDYWRAVFFPESYLEYQINENGKVETYGATPDEYLTDMLRNKALDFFSHAKNDPRPFFLYLAPLAPHAPAEPAARHANALPGIQAPRPPSFNEEDVSDKPEWVRRLPLMTEETTARTDEWYRRRAQSMLAVDEMLTTLVDSLHDSGRLENTYLIFTSDNGFQLGPHRMDHGKGDGYEESIRVPLIVRGPGVPTGARVDAPVLNIDVAPTIAELTGARAADFVDGRSFVPFLRGIKPKTWRKDFLIEHWTDEEDGIPNYLGLHTSEHVYLEYPSGERELYDLKRDPYQMQSVHASAPALAQKLAARLASLKDCKAAGCRD
jgi:N-acetylglucosamine-6-sulfatase